MEKTGETEVTISATKEEWDVVAKVVRIASNVFALTAKEKDITQKFYDTAMDRREGGYSNPPQTLAGSSSERANRGLEAAKTVYEDSVLHRF